jgi:uncharacterized membrane protein
MRIHYQTGIATLVQFTAMSALGVISGINSSLGACTKQDGNCSTNVLLSVVFFLLTALFFAAVWVLGSTAQNQRSSLLARALILIELGIVLVALFNIQHRSNLLNLATSVLDIGLASWIIILAYRLSKSKGARIVRTATKAPPRIHNRHHPISKN